MGIFDRNKRKGGFMDEIRCDEPSYLIWKWHPSGVQLILTDLDGLKHINDTFGHEEGDVAIRTAAQALMAACPSDAVCTRFGGDEMLAVCFGNYNASDIKSAVRKYCDEFNSTAGKPYNVSVSVGIYFTDANMDLSFEELVRNSDKLMYMEKEKKRAKEQYNSVK